MGRRAQGWVAHTALRAVAVKFFHERPRAWTAAAVVVAAVAVATPVLAKPRTDPRVFGTKKKVFGRSFADWTVEWWQWAESIPVSVHPLFDETGARVEVGQRGPVWFLGGVFNQSGTATRTANIPAGKALLIPLVNFINTNVWGLDPPEPIAALRSGTSSLMASVDLESLHLTLDGAEIEGVDRMRVVSKLFTIATPTDNVFASFGAPVSRGVHGYAVSDGFWCMLKPLEPGRHTLRSQAAVGGQVAFSIDVTYELNVVDHDQP